MLLRIFEIVLIFNTAYAIEKSRGALGSRVFTFVHGDENAKLNFSEAENYCKFVGQQSDNNDMLDSLNKHDRQHVSSQAPQNSKEKMVLQTALASIHSYPENLALVNWISKQEKHSFWIGGKITKTVNEFMRPLYVLHWVDGSKSDFSLLRLPNPEMTSISVGEQRCVSVDYSSGQWGVHLCSEKRYFVCLTVPVLSTDNQMISKQKEQSSLTVPNKSESKDTLIDDELGSML
ncbi:Bone marrow proteoglycan [Schistosoma japonicum]|uniref:Bone marrow proteoglycan n=1 Tax=Schistosoma japonicum TaxID=6182 RepID=A0A4Z2D460_SCHJA|nr:Bone marrow proteoglycan [Schistosoma japonicum]